MRTLLVCLAVLSLTTATACKTRDNMTVVPNREGRAGGDGSQKVGDGGISPVAKPETEQYYTMVAGEDLYAVAKKFNTTTEWLIKRNEIMDVKALQPGKNLIVPLKK